GDSLVSAPLRLGRASRPRRPEPRPAPLPRVPSAQVHRRELPPAQALLGRRAGAHAAQEPPPVARRGRIPRTRDLRPSAQGAGGRAPRALSQRPPVDLRGCSARLGRWPRLRSPRASRRRDFSEAERGERRGPQRALLPPTPAPEARVLRAQLSAISAPSALKNLARAGRYRVPSGSAVNPVRSQ